MEDVLVLKYRYVSSNFRVYASNSLFLTQIMSNKFLSQMKRVGVSGFPFLRVLVPKKREPISKSILIHFNPFFNARECSHTLLLSFHRKLRVGSGFPGTETWPGFRFLGTRNPKPHARSSFPETRNPARFPFLETRNPLQGCAARKKRGMVRSVKIKITWLFLKINFSNELSKKQLCHLQCLYFTELFVKTL